MAKLKDADVAADRAELAALVELERNPPPIFLRYQPGSNPDMDKTLRTATAHIAAVGGGPIVLRLIPQFKFPGTKKIAAKYIPWSGVTWSIGFMDPAYVKEFREALQEFVSTWVPRRAKEIQEQEGGAAR